MALHFRQRKNSTVLMFQCKTPFSKKREQCVTCLSLVAALSTAAHLNTLLMKNTQLLAFLYTEIKFDHILPANYAVVFFAMLP